MSAFTLPQVVCGVIPHHILTRVAGQRDVEASVNARATLEHMRELAASGQTLIAAEALSDDRQRVYDAGNQYELPGRLVLPGPFRGGDVQVTEAWDGGGATCDFFERVFGRRSIDGAGLRLDSTVHYGTASGTPSGTAVNWSTATETDTSSGALRRRSTSSRTSSRTVSRSTPPPSATSARPAL